MVYTFNIYIWIYSNLFEEKCASLKIILVLFTITGNIQASHSVVSFRPFFLPPLWRRAATEFISDHYSRHLYGCSFTLCSVLLLLLLLYYPRFSTSTYLPTSLSIQFLPWLGRTTRLFPFFLTYLFISSHFLDRTRYKSNKDTSIISIFSCSKFYRFNSSSWNGSKRKLAALFLFSLMTDDRSKDRTKR